MRSQPAASTIDTPGATKLFLHPVSRSSIYTPVTIKRQIMKAKNTRVTPYTSITW